MITVHMLGGALKSFPAGDISLDCAGCTLSDMIRLLLAAKPEGTPPLDMQNVLLAVNGADSSSLDGHDTILHDGDRVSIIPVIHGGSDILMWDVDNIPVMATCAAGPDIDLDALRHELPTIWIQAVDSRYVLDENHLRRIVEVTMAAKDTGNMLGRRPEIDLLLRLAQTTQISAAISRAGVGAGSVVLVAAGDASSLKQLAIHMAGRTLPFPDGSGSEFLQDLTSMQATDIHTLSELLAERASLLCQ